MLNKAMFQVKFLTSLGKVNDYVTDIYTKCMDVNIKLFIFLNMRDHFTKKAKMGRHHKNVIYFITLFLSICLLIFIWYFTLYLEVIFNTDN